VPRSQGREVGVLLGLSGISGTGTLIIGHAIPCVQLMPVRSDLSLAGALGAGLAAGVRTGSCARTTPTLRAIVTRAATKERMLIIAHFTTFS